MQVIPRAPLKIGIITFHVSDNYGAIMQTYAMQRALELHGENVEIINYIPKHRKTKLHIIHRINKKEETQNYLRYIASILYRLITDIINYDRKRLRLHYIQKFIDQKYKLSEDEFTTFDELKTGYPKYDFYLVGSDQVWNPHNTGGEFDPAYFLTFVHDNSCATYAPSLGRFNVLQNGEMFSEYTKNLKHIGVREKASIPSIEQLTGKKVICNVDPTFLLSTEEWNKIALEPKDYNGEKFIFLYYLGSNVEVKSLAQLVSHTLGLPIKEVNFSLRPKVIIKPEEFPWYFSHASFVITDSFHGTVFSILNKKPFYTVQPDGNKSRVVNLLTSLNLIDRFRTSNERIETVSSVIDYNDVYIHLDALRQSSLRYLDNIIQEQKIFLNIMTEDR